MGENKYTWVPFYEELADKLLTFKSNRTELIEKVKEAHQMMGLSLPKIEKGNDNIPDIDPFTVIALFNRGKQSEASRQKICEGYKNVFGMTNTVDPACLTPQRGVCIAPLWDWHIFRMLRREPENK